MDLSKYMINEDGQECDPHYDLTCLTTTEKLLLGIMAIV